MIDPERGRASLLALVEHHVVQLAAVAEYIRSLPGDSEILLAADAVEHEQPWFWHAPEDSSVMAFLREVARLEVDPAKAVQAYVHAELLDDITGL